MMPSLQSSQPPVTFQGLQGADLGEDTQILPHLEKMREDGKVASGDTSFTGFLPSLFLIALSGNEKAFLAHLPFSR